MKRMDDFLSLFHDKLQKAEMNVPADAWSGLLSDLHVAEAAERPAFYIGRAWWAAAASVAVLLGVAVWMWQGVEPSQEVAPLAQIPTSVAPAPVALPDVQPVQAEASRSSARSLPVIWIPDAHNATYDEADDEEMVEVTVTIQTQVFGTRQPGIGEGFAAASHETTPTNDSSAPASDPTSATPHLRSWKLALAAGSAWPSGNHQAPLTVGLMLQKELSPSLAVETGLRFTHYPEKGGADVQTLSLPVQLDVTLAKAEKTKVYAVVGGAVEKTLGHDFKEDPLQLSARGGVGVEYKLSDRLALYAEPAVTYRLTDGCQSAYLHTAQRAGVELTGGLRMSF